MVRIGAWLFRNRGWLPVPLLLAMMVPPPRFWAPGIVVLLLGESIRLWAVGHIGLPSRTRSADVTGLVVSGPYRHVRNPLYVGNLLLFTGLGILCYPAVVGVPLLALHYAAIVRWEEANLLEHLGPAWVRWSRMVPRWIPRLRPAPTDARRWDGVRALRSERSTFLAILVVLGALLLRAGAL